MKQNNKITILSDGSIVKEKVLGRGLCVLVLVILIALSTLLYLQIKSDKVKLESSRLELAATVLKLKETEAVNVQNLKTIKELTNHQKELESKIAELANRLKNIEEDK